MFETFFHLLLILVNVVLTLVTVSVFVMGMVILAMVIIHEVIDKGKDHTQDKDLI